MRDRGVGSWIVRRARRTPTRDALLYEGRRWSYEDLAGRIDGLARGLSALGVRRGDRFAYIGPDHPDLLVTFFAAARLGAVLVPISPLLSADEAAYILRDAGCTAAAYDDVVNDTVRRVRDAVPVRSWVVAGGGSAGAETGVASRASAPDTEAGEAAPAGAAPGGGETTVPMEEDVRAATDHALDALVLPETDPVDEPVDPRDPCLLAYTAAETGRPKAVIRTHESFGWAAFDALASLDVSEHDVHLTLSTADRLGGSGSLVLETLLKGGGVVLLPAFEPDAALARIEHYRVTTLTAGPAALERMARASTWEQADLSSLRFCLCAGTDVPDALVRAWLDRGIPCAAVFGLAEAGGLVAVPDLRAADAAVGTRGPPLMFTDVRVARPSGQPEEPGHAGEILVEGPGVTPGYWEHAEASDAVRRDGWLRTRSAGELDEDGRLSVVEQPTRVYGVGDEEVYAAEVERALVAHPEVAEAAAIGVPDSDRGMTGAAFVVPEPSNGARPDPDRLRRHLAGLLAHHKVPREIQIVEGLPRTPKGRVERKRLRAQWEAEHETGAS